MMIWFGSRHSDRRHLLDGHGRTVDLDPQRIHQAGVRPTGANAGQIALELANGLLHALFNIQQDFVGGHGPNPQFLLMDQRAHPLAQHGVFDVPFLAEVEHEDGQVVFRALGDGLVIHDAEVLPAHVVVA